LLALGEVTAIAETEATAKAATTASEGNIGDERTWGKGAGLRLVGGKNYFVRSDGRHTFSQRRPVTAATTPLLYLQITGRNFIGLSSKSKRSTKSGSNR
jgi:hypothetical protein